MSSLYLLINLFVIAGPLALSFDKKVAFYRSWKALLIGMFVMMSIYIPWDMAFTKFGVWGFNQNYLTGFTLGNLPVEEVLFFVTVPYACTFIYACVKAYLKIKISTMLKNVLLAVLVALLISIIFIGSSQQYSFYTSLCSLLTLLAFILIFRRNDFWGNFFVSYLIAMIPFLIVNGILTGSKIEGEVVWYNSEHIFNLRLLTIPVEDSIYNLGMLLITIGTYEFFLNKAKNREKTIF